MADKRPALGKGQDHLLAKSPAAASDLASEAVA